MIDRNDSRSDLVVLVHGFGAKRAVMWPLASRLRVNGFRVLNWNYLSLFAAIETHANRLCDFLATQLSLEPRFHIVAHSMGSIVTRAALNRSSLPNLGRLVLLAPPNAGSPAARFASFFIGRVITPTRELSDQDSSYVNQLTQQTELDVGILAARYDILVPTRNTHLRGERMHETRHFVQRTTHYCFPVRFPRRLRGSFVRETSSCPITMRSTEVADRLSPDGEFFGRDIGDRGRSSFV